MPVEALKSYQDVLKYLNDKKRVKHLLLGNGFSMAYDPKIFSYNALSNFVENTGDELINKLFSSIKTRNFELIMQQLNIFCEIADAFGSDSSLVKKVKNASEILQNNLIKAVNELHPEHIFKMPAEKSNHCASFLSNYLSKNSGSVFSTNYDLLLYWVLMRNNVPNTNDGFGRERVNPEDVPYEDAEHSDLLWGINKSGQNIHYLHGALHLFDSGIYTVKEEYDGNNLLDNIKHRMANVDYPIFVTAGDGNEKLTHIVHNKYLSYCYDKLSEIGGSLVTFGFNFGEYDTHIIDAINAAAHKRRGKDKLLSIYIGVYSDADLGHINRISNKFTCKVNLYNARTTNVWGG